MKGSDFIFDCANLLHCNCQKIYLKCGASDKWFHDAATVSLNHAEISKEYQKLRVL